MNYLPTTISAAAEVLFISHNGRVAYYNFGRSPCWNHVKHCNAWKKLTSCFQILPTAIQTEKELLQPTEIHFVVLIVVVVVVVVVLLGYAEMTISSFSKKIHFSAKTCFSCCWAKKIHLSSKTCF